MKVKLIQAIKKPVDVMWVAARTCYSEKSPIEIWYDADYRNKPYNPGDPVEIHNVSELKEHENKKWNLVKKVLDSGHQSIAEHVYFTFAIEGISRACSHQLVRHRAGIVFSQQSQRYVEIKESLQELRDIREHNGVAKTAGIVEKYFVPSQDGMSGLKYAELDCLIEYRRLIEEESMAPEDARQVLPNATKTNITMSINLRELIHICNLRLCTRAQSEIRQLFKLIKDEVNNVEPKLASLLVPSCEVYGFCTEGKCCGKKPHISKIMAVYNSEDKLTPELEEAMKNPKFNKKLSELIKMNSVIE